MEERNEKYANITVKNLGNSEVEITGEIPVSVLAGYRPRVLRRLSESLAVDGFRQGHVPESIIVSKIGEIGILEEMAEYALQDMYLFLLQEHAINAIGALHITMTKLAPQNPLGFKIQTAVLPVIVLPDYKSIARKIMEKKDEIVVPEKEIQEAILYIRKIMHHAEQQEDETTQKDEDIPPENLPPFDDALAQKMGGFKSAEEFIQQLRQNMLNEKTAHANEKRRMEIIEEVAAHTPVTLPRILIESELAMMRAQFEGDIKRADMNVEDYLAQIKKTIDDLRKEWLPDAEKRSKIQLILNTIAEKENIVVPDSGPEMNEAVTALQKQHPKTEKEILQNYVRKMLSNKKVFDFLEQNKEIAGS